MPTTTDKSDEFFDNPTKKCKMFLTPVDARQRRRKTPKKDLESGVVKECLIWLNRQGYYCERRNTGAVRTAQDFLLQFGRVGAADIFAVIHGRHIEIECKRRDGKGQQSDNQIEFQRLMNDYHIPYLLVTSKMDLAIRVEALLLHWSR